MTPTQHNKSPEYGLLRMTNAPPGFRDPIYPKTGPAESKAPSKHQQRPQREKAQQAELISKMAYLSLKKD
jgi:hypothetical protein